MIFLFYPALRLLKAFTWHICIIPIWNGSYLLLLGQVRKVGFKNYWSDPISRTMSADNVWWFLVLIFLGKTSCTLKLEKNIDFCCFTVCLLSIIKFGGGGESVRACWETCASTTLIWNRDTLWHFASSHGKYILVLPTIISQNRDCKTGQRQKPEIQNQNAS